MSNLELEMNKVNNHKLNSSFIYPINIIKGKKIFEGMIFI